MWSIRPETDCSVFPTLACLKGRCNLVQRYAQIAVVTVARRRHRRKDRCGEIVWCSIFHVCGPSGWKKGETYHLSSNAMFELAHTIIYCSLFGIWVDQGPACSVWRAQPWGDQTSPEAAGPNTWEEKGVEKVGLSLLISLSELPAHISEVPRDDRQRNHATARTADESQRVRCHAPSAHSKMTFLCSH